MTAYRLRCEHVAIVLGPAGATSGRAWCEVCGYSQPVLHPVPLGPAFAELAATLERTTR